MSLNYQQVRNQVQELGESAVFREQQLRHLREQATALLQNNAHDLASLRDKVHRARQHDPSLRCAVPVIEPLDGHFPVPALPPRATLLAVDGSQITPDRHAAVQYGLINVGAIRLDHGTAQPPVTTIECQLLYDDSLYTASGTITDDLLSLKRDLNERRLLAEMVSPAPWPFITFTDGPLELWGAKDSSGEDGSEFRKSLDQYLEALSQLYAAGAATAGYVDKPGADLVVRLLEVVSTPDAELPGIRNLHPLRGVRDLELFAGLLEPGERSAVFGIQSQSARQYRNELGLNFFYLNVGRPGDAYLARVEIPAWVVDAPNMLNPLHALLVQQCRVLGSRPYPYLLHRAHETAVVSLDEKEQVTQMILLELRKRHLPVGVVSNKQHHKGHAGRTRY